MDQLTSLDELGRQIGVLACVDETQAPFASCYLNLERGEAGYRKAFKDRGSVPRAALDGHAREDFEAALVQIEADLAERLRPIDATEELVRLSLEDISGRQDLVREHR